MSIRISRLCLAVVLPLLACLLCPVPPAREGEALAAPINFRPETATIHDPDDDLVERDPDWGAVRGRIVWPERQAVIAPKAFLVAKDRQACLNQGPIVSEEWVIDPKSRGIRWVVVWLMPEKGKDLPIHPDLKESKPKEAIIAIPCCRFEPHVLAMREGQDLVVRNDSPVCHTFQYAGHPLHNPGGQVLIPAKTTESIKGLKADPRLPVTVRCPIHGWMGAYVRVFGHPYFCVTDERGRFTIRHAPAGDWRLMMWHDTGWRGGAAGRDGEKIRVRGGEVVNLGDLAWKPVE